MGNKSVGECPTLYSSAGMNHHPRLLVHYYKILIFINDIERYRFGNQLDDRGRREFYLYLVGLSDAIARFRDRVIDQHIAGSDLLMESGSAVIGKLRGE